MKKKTFQVLITTKFSKVVDVEAKDEKDAIQQVEESIFNGDIEDGVTSEEPETEVSLW